MTDPNSSGGKPPEKIWPYIVAAIVGSPAVVYFVAKSCNPDIDVTGPDISNTDQTSPEDENPSFDPYDDLPPSTNSMPSPDEGAVAMFIFGLFVLGWI